jgi:guanylate kinase
MSQGLLIVVSGPSGAGKGTVCRAYMEKHPDTLLSISATTRAPRSGEKEGVNYFFLRDAEFEKKIEEGDFLEHAKVYGHHYGTPRKYVRDNLMHGRDIILEIDIQGALAVKDRCEEGVFIFIVPPSMEELKRRIIARGTETKKEALKRFKQSYEELNFISRYNYVIVNDTIEEAVRKMEAIITAEKCHVSRFREWSIPDKEEE